ncbi:MAG: EAL domain-containing protein [Chloroflexota bacterium]
MSVGEGAPLAEERLRVLIVEDLPSDAELMVLRLEDEGLRPIWRRVQTEPEFLAALDPVPDVILSDWRLPRFSGLRALELAREAVPEVPFLIVSGNIGEEAAIEALHRGADDYVLKDRAARLGSAVRRAREAARLRTEQRRAEAQLAFQAEILANVRDSVVAVDPRGRVVYWNIGASRTFGWAASEVVGRSFGNVLGTDEGLLDRVMVPILSGQEVTGVFSALTRDGGRIWIDARMTPRLGPDGEILGIVGVARDVTQQQEERLERERLATAIEQSGDSVLITDLQARLVYVNSAFTRQTGYAPEEAIGRNPRFLKSGEHPPAFYEAMWQTLTAGGTWVAEFVNRRKDGRTYTELSTISPIRDATGRIVSYVAVNHDLTKERELEATARRLTAERALIADTLAHLEPGITAEATAAAICHKVVGLSDVAGVAVARFDHDGSAIPLALVTADGAELPVGGLQAARGREVFDQLVHGPFVETWDPGDPSDWGRALAPYGINAIAHLPVRFANEVLGAMSAGATGPDAAARLREALGTLAEFADLGGVVLGPALMEQSARGARTRTMRRVIEERRFRPLYQPIVDLRTAAIQGYEALTRFSSGEPPDECLREAWEIGLGVELELAILRAAIEGSEQLPAGHWLNLNVSPRLLVMAPDLAGLLRTAAARPIVLEVTEHEQVANYALLREAVRSMGDGLRLAVDDAGAGAANFGHIVELRADFVKLDISLIRGIDTDIGRQALVVGMRHFARAAGCRLIAEGVETAAEATTAAALGTELGQGYLFGSPAPADHWAMVGTRSTGGGPTSRPSQ